MSSALMKALKRTVCAVICYGMVFSYPSWTIFGRVAHASNAGGPPPGITDVNVNIDPTKKPVVTPPPKAAPTDGKKHDEKPTGTGSKTDEKKLPPAAVGGKCSEDKFLINATSGSLNYAAGDSICSQGQSDPRIWPRCWTQFFVFLGAAEANSYYANGSADRSPASGVAARTLSSVKDIVPKHHEELSKSGGEGVLTKILDKMSRPDLIQNQDSKQCCMQLVDQARRVAAFIKTSSKNPARPDLTPNKNQQTQMDELIAQKEAQCSSNDGGVIIGGGHTAPPPPEKEKKKNGMLMAVLIALGVGLLIWALTKKKKKKKKRPTETPPPCKGKNCGGGGSGGASTGRPPCNTGNCGNNVGTTTAEEPPVTNGGNTYPSTNGDTTRGNSTGDTGGNTYPSTNGDTTRGNSTGDTGTVTGSTTATTGDDDPPSTTGSTTLDDPVSGGDGPGRTTSGTTRPLAPSRTLIKD